ncbi:hypothetical protein [Streptomyces sp. NPDC046939]|uniref:hypothetical protein n=1 Tax=Streptomyces sp. NPDC046939 TaxID=3155376 RepID=UPI0033C136EE
MRFTPTLRLGDVLVVLEGPARMLWDEPAAVPGERAWTPKGLWPDATQHAEVRAHLGGGRPLLVLLDEARSRVPLLREEWQAASRRLTRELAGVRCENLTHDTDELVEVRLPFLDWLPQPHRERARRFLAESDAVLSRTPKALLPPLLAEEPVDGAVPNPRFARRLQPHTLNADRFAAAVHHLFADAPLRPCTAEMVCGGAR